MQVDVSEFFDGFQACPQADTVGDLYGETRSGIQLKNHRTTVFVKDKIAADIAKAGHVVAFGGQLQNLVPVGDGEVGEIHTGVGVAFNQHVPLHRPDRLAGTNIQTDTNSTLVQVCLAV